MDVGGVRTVDMSGEVDAHGLSKMSRVTWWISFMALVTSVVRGRSASLLETHKRVKERHVFTFIGHPVEMNETGVVIGMVYSHGPRYRLRQPRRQ